MNAPTPSPEAIKHLGRGWRTAVVRFVETDGSTREVPVFDEAAARKTTAGLDWDFDEWMANIDAAIAERDAK